MMWYWGGGVHWWSWLLGLSVMVLFWGIVVWAVWYLVSSLLQGPERSGPPSDAKRILDERLARGEIDAGEYERLRDLIAEEGRPAPQSRQAAEAAPKR